MPRHPRLLIAAVLILAACVHGSAQSPSAPAAASASGIAAIEAYKGTWKISTVTVDTAHSKAAKDEKVLRNDCWRSAGYYACNQFLDGKSQDLIVFTFHEDKNLYTTYIVPLDGSAASSGTLEIHGDTWIYPWESTEKGITTYFRVINVFKSPTTIQFRSEFSSDKQTWTPTATGTEVRLSD